MSDSACPGKTGKVGRTEAVRAGTKQAKQTDDGATARMPLKRPPQIPVHVRVLQSKSQQEVARPQEAAPLIRRSRSGPPTSSAVPSRAPPPSSPSPNLVHRSTQLPTQVKRAPSLPAQPSSSQQQPNPAKRAPSVPAQPSSSQQQPNPAKQKLVERAIKARLYLLYQSGPNRFLVGGDAPDSRFHVTIGPQQCTCNKTPCIHLLFVMVRVLKVNQSDPMLWQKQLRNYEAESLLQEFQARVSLRSTPKKINRRSFDFSSRRSPEGETKSSHVLTKSNSDDHEQLKPKSGEGPGRMARTPPPNSVCEERADSHRSDGDGEGEEEEDVCPICLNELDEGEDLIVCEGCHNQLHQHCMDIWAGEQLRKNEPVHCPVCWTLWPHATPTISPSSGGPSMMPVSVPVGAEGGESLGGLRLKSLASAPGSEKEELREKLKPLFSPGVVDGLFAPDWKIRESSLTLLSRETITHLIPQLTAKLQPVAPGNVRETQQLCMQVVAHACTDSVLKVFLAALELMRVILGYSSCHSYEEANFLQSTLRPVLPVLLKRCADAQQRVKECSVDTVCNLCLGQSGPLSVGSASGSQSQFGVSDLQFVLGCVLSGEEEEERGHSWHWWLGRVNFLDRLISRFTLEFLLMNSVIETQCHSSGDPDSESTSATATSLDSLASNASTLVESHTSSETESGHEMRPGSECPGMEPELTTSSDAVPSCTKLTVENNLLVRAWYFAARATHVPHHKLGKVGRRVIIRIAKVLRDHPSSLEIVHHVVSKCHRTHAEGLLDRVLKAREKPHEAGDYRSKNREERRPREEVVRQSAKRTLLPKSPEPLLLPLVGAAASSQSSALARSDRVKRMEMIGEEGDFVASDDSFRSAVSDLDGDVGRQGGSEGLEASSSTSNSNDSKERGEKGAAEGGVASGGSDLVLPRRVSFKRQSTVDSVFSSDMESSIDSGYLSVAPGQHCKKNIEEEEAEAEARVRSMLPQDMPHPSLSGVPPPTVEVLIHVQPSGDRRTSDESTDGSFVPYLEGVHWVKGRIIGTGAFCSCYLARDVENGIMFAVKQVSYVRNTKAHEEEELQRLKAEVAMLSRINHPNLVRCLGATQHDGHINIFIEWMAGGCLDQILHDFGHPFVEKVICNYTRQIVRGIVYLHEHGIIHRDLKGGNILVDSTGQRIRIADFGAAARLASLRTGPGEFQDMEGTVAFMAPEVVRGGNIDDLGNNMGYGRKCDVWSIGCIIIQMATAKPPWVGTYDVSNKYQLIFKIGQTTTPPPLPNFSSPALRDLAIRCLEVRPEDRPMSSELLKHSLFTESKN